MPAEPSRIVAENLALRQLPFRYQDVGKPQHEFLAVQLSANLGRDVDAAAAHPGRSRLADDFQKLEAVADRRAVFPQPFVFTRVKLAAGVGFFLAAVHDYLDGFRMAGHDRFDAYKRFLWLLLASDQGKVLRRRRCSDRRKLNRRLDNDRNSGDGKFWSGKLSRRRFQRRKLPR